MITDARDARPPGRAAPLLANSMPTGWCRTLQPVAAQQGTRPLSGHDDLADAVIDVDVPDGEAARSLAIKVLPSTTPFLLVQYRVPIASGRHFDDAYYDHGQYRHVATAVRSGVVTVRPSGPLGVVGVRLKPEAAPRFLGSGMGAFANAKIGLGDMLKPAVVSVLEARVAAAGTSAERIALVMDFLRSNLCERDPDPLASCAAKRLRHRPLVRIRVLAGELGVSERSLCRRFHAVFGVSPKEFARVARLEKVLAARASGLAWANLSYACGFSDQAHMINDTRAILGASPQQALAVPAVARGGGSAAMPLFMW